MIDLYIDFKCPASYLAVRPTLALAERLGVPINWHPFRSRQPAIPAEQSGETKGETHRRVRAIQRRDTHLRYADAQGVTMRFREECGESDTALAGLLAVQGDRTAFVRSCFDAYWVRGLDLGDADVVRQLAEAAGGALPPGALAGPGAAIDIWQERSENEGIFFTPTYIVAEQLFVGREHLPWIEELLRG